jgi:hypothetical protein
MVPYSPSKPGAIDTAPERILPMASARSSPELPGQGRERIAPRGASSRMANSLPAASMRAR